MTTGIDHSDPFRFDYRPPIIQCGAACIENLGAELQRASLESALVVCGSTVGTVDDVIGPVTDALGDRCVDVFDETTPAKRLDTAFRVSERLADTGADAIVGLGGGSSLDIAKVASVLAGSDDSRGHIVETFATTGTIPVPGDTASDNCPPVVTVPTTLAGADISQAAGITAAPNTSTVDTERGGGLAHPALMPHAVFADPTLVETTPRSVLAGSAMNGFDKGIETLYAMNATPMTDGTAMRGLELFTEGLLAYGSGDRSHETYEALVRGLVTVQTGISRPDGTTLSFIHAFGHALSRTGDLQQGTAHGIVAPHALDLLFERVDGRRERLARALGVGDSQNPATAVVDRVAEIRDGLELPSQLRDVAGPKRENFDKVAADVLGDPFVYNTPRGFDPDEGDIIDVLEQAW